MIPASTLYAVLEKLGRTGRVSQTGEIHYLDGSPAPSEAEWQAALEVVQSRKIITAARFEQLFTEGEKHDIFRRASQSINTSALAPKFAALQYRFRTLGSVYSDSAELQQTLAFLEQTGVITAARRARIAAFLPPEA